MEEVLLVEVSLAYKRFCWLIRVLSEKLYWFYWFRNRFVHRGSGSHQDNFHTPPEETQGAMEMVRMEGARVSAVGRQSSGNVVELKSSRLVVCSPARWAQTIAGRH